MDDPCPEGDLDSDVAFGTWLESLDPEEVIRNHYRATERRMTKWEVSNLRYLRRRARTEREKEEQ